MNTVPQHLGKYELRERLGRGGMAEVWKAFDTQLQRFVALKILHADLQNDPTFIARFEREAQVIASLHHPNIVQIFDFQVARPPESSSTIAYMVMDYVEGPTLAEYIRDTSRVGQIPTPSDIVYLFASISKAIDYAHHKGMIHRDIKPANILLDRRNTAQNAMGEPVLTDFGIVKLLGASTGTQSGTWLGTPLYISPEQAQGHPGNERSDIYSLGIILYEICTGIQPFRGDTVAAIIIQHITATPTPPALLNPQIPPALSMVMLRCLAKEPATRFSSAGSLAAAIAEALNLPVPADLPRPTFPVPEIQGPTYITPLPAVAQLGTTPSSPSIPGGPAAYYSSQAAALLAQSAATRASYDPLSPLPVVASTPPGNTPGAPAVASRTPVVATSFTAGQAPGRPPESVPAPVTPAPITPFTPPPPSKRRRRGLFVALIVLLLVIVLGGALSALLVFTRPSPSAPAATNQAVGLVRFLSSGRFHSDNNLGINDELLIDLHNIQNPASGKAYYAWLLADTDESGAPPLLLGNGPLAVQNSSIHYVFPGDAQHSNLLLNYSRFLITEEDAQTTPNVPSFDLSAWRYAAPIPHTPNPKDTKSHFSMLDHLRHLLANDKSIVSIGLTGGLSIWMLRNTEEVLKWAVGADDSWRSHNATAVRQQVLNILYYLDGVACIVPDLQNVPQGIPTAAENATIGNIARVPLLDTCTQPHVLGYVLHIGIHLAGVTDAPGATQATRNAASQINNAINQLKTWLEQVRADAVKLVSMTNNQITQPPALDLLGDMETQARYAYAGQIDPVSGAYLGGVLWIYGGIQRLAVFNVMPCKSSTTSACV